MNAVPSRARARSVEEMRELGKRAGDLLREGKYVIEAARAIGVPVRTFNDWLDGSDAGAVAFADGVMDGYAEAAHKGEAQAFADIGSTEMGSGAYSSFHRWRLEKRWPRVFGAARTEITGKDGGPIQTQDITHVPTDELLELAKQGGAAEDEE